MKPWPADYCCSIPKTSIRQKPAKCCEPLQPDLFIVADYGQILSRVTLGLARLGGINLHGSLLPKYRGAAPINWALYRGETASGVSAIHMTPQLDAGPVLAQTRTSIQPTENALELERRLSDIGASLICQVIEDLQRGTTSHIPQDPAEATKARRLRKTDGQIDWSRSAAAINNQVRALVPWPMCYTFWQRRQGEPLRLIIGRTSVVSQSTAAEPGTVVVSERNRLIVATGDSQHGLSLDEIQPAGKRMLSAEDFLRGYPVALGERMGPVDECSNAADAGAV